MHDDELEFKWKLNKTGCYNLVCEGFVQTNREISIGGTFDNLSTYDGKKYLVTTLIMKDPQNGNWWFMLNDVSVGYWPSSIFSYLKDYGTVVEWGGEILNQKRGGQHTTTVMGSGHFPGEGFKRSCHMNHIFIVDEHNVKKEPEITEFVINNKKCYDLIHGSHDPNWRTYIYFGGPGRNPNCT